MKQYLRSKVSRISSYVEIYLSVLLILGILFVSLDLVADIILGFRSLMSGSMSFHYEAFLNVALQLIIGIEFVKMITKHTPESAIDVLLFALARKMIIGETKHIDIILGTLAISVLFIIKRFLIVPNASDPEGFILDSSTSIKELNSIVKSELPKEEGLTLGEFVSREFKKQGIYLSEGKYIIWGDNKLKIYSMCGDTIEKIEVTPLQTSWLGKWKAGFKNRR